MSTLNFFDSLDEEIKDLLQNYKLKKTTAYEPCTSKNFKECLIGLHEELGLFNINYIFNPYCDLENNTISTEALVNLINSVWTLLQYHKSCSDKCKRLMEENHVLESTNKQLIGVKKTITDKLNLEKNESRACVASAQRISDQSRDIYQKFLETKIKLQQVSKQKETNEKSLQNKISRLILENEKLKDRLRNNSGNFTPCADICDSTLTQLKDRDIKHRAVIAQLQANNQEMLREIVSLKDELILTGLDSVILRK